MFFNLLSIRLLHPYHRTPRPSDALVMPYRATSIQCFSYHTSQIIYILPYHAERNAYAPLISTLSPTLCRCSSLALPPIGLTTVPLTAHTVAPLRTLALPLSGLLTCLSFLIHLLLSYLNLLSIQFFAQYIIPSHNENNTPSR